jgi:hypothetical protein
VWRNVREIKKHKDKRLAFLTVSEFSGYGSLKFTEI